MKGYIIGLVIAVVICVVGLVFWHLVLKPKPPAIETPLEEPGFKPIQEGVPLPPVITETAPTLISPTPITWTPPEPPLITPNPTISPEPVSEFENYEVKKGDTLWDIAKKFYHDGTKYKLIYEANKDKLASPDTHLKPGMKLAIPKSGVQERVTERPIERIKPEGGTYYTVKKGDTLEKIALKFYKDRTKYRGIFEANRDKLTTPETTLKIGWKLFIPTSGEAPAEPKPQKTPIEENIPKGAPE